MKFYHVIDRKKSVGITVAVEIKKDSTPNFIECAVSYCAPMEPNFSRSKGRLIAESRLSSQRNMPLFKRFSFVTPNQRGLKGQILSCLSKSLYRGWAKSLVDKELKRLQTVQLQKTADSEEIPF